MKTLADAHLRNDAKWKKIQLGAIDEAIRVSDTLNLDLAAIKTRLLLLLEEEWGDILCTRCVPSADYYVERDLSLMIQRSTSQELFAVLDKAYDTAVEIIQK